MASARDGGCMVPSRPGSIKSIIAETDQRREGAPARGTEATGGMRASKGGVRSRGVGPGQAASGQSGGKRRNDGKDNQSFAVGQ